jgi:AraC-like DNA-binding protein
MTFTAWNGRLAFGPWWLLHSGPIVPTERHAHHAFQIIVHGGTPCVVDAADEPMPGPLVVVEPDQPHAVRDRRDYALVVFVEPESRVGISLRQPETSRPDFGRSHPVAELIGDLRPDNWSRADETVRRVLAAVGVTEPSVPLRWWRHPAVDEALLRMRESVDDGSADIGELASTVGVSTTRLAHVFSAEIGMPLRSYAHWLRLVRAAEHLAEGSTITEAAHAARFANAAQLSTVFKEMFGLTPSDVMAAGSWIR